MGVHTSTLQQARQILLALVLGCVCAGCAQSDEFALHIFGTASCLGAEVLIDSEVRGSMEEFGGDGSHFSIWLPHGTHAVTLRKNGYVPIEEKVEVHAPESEYYLSVELDRTSADAGMDDPQ